MGRDYNLYKWRALVHWVHFGQAEQMCNCVYDEKIAVIEKQLRPSICEMFVKLQLQID